MMIQPAAVNRSCQRSARLLEHRHLVIPIARRLLPRLPANVGLDELMQAGMIGLNEAMSRFDDQRGASFSTYASRRIEGAMLDELRAMDTVPRSKRADQRKLRVTVQRLEQQLGRAPRAKEVADALGMTLADFHGCMLDIGAGGLRAGDTFLDELEDESSVSGSARESSFNEQTDPLWGLEMRRRLALLSKAFEHVAERERLVMDLTYGQGLRLKEVGAALGVSESRVCHVRSTRALSQGYASVSRTANPI